MYYFAHTVFADIEENPIVDNKHDDKIANKFRKHFVGKRRVFSLVLMDS